MKAGHLRNGLLALTASLALLLQFWTAAQADDQKPLTLTLIEATPAFHSLPIFALKQNAKDYNLEVENLQIQGGGDAGIIFAGGNADIMLAGIDKPVGFLVKDLVDVKVFGVVLKSMNWSLVVPTASEIKTVEELKGKTIGISGAGSSSDMLMRWALRKAGLDPDKDVTLVALGSVANLHAGIENGKVDAAVLVRPFLTKALDAGTVRVVGDWEAMPFPNLVAIGRTEDLEKNPEKFQRFRNALGDILNKFKNDRPFALAMAKAAYPNATEEELSKQLDFALDVYWKPLGPDMSEDLYKQAADILVTSRVVPEGKMPSYDKLVTTVH